MIPKSFTEKYLKMANGTTFFGIPINELTREELIAMAVAGWNAEKQSIEQASKERKFLLSLIKR